MNSGSPINKLDYPFFQNALENDKTEAKSCLWDFTNYHRLLADAKSIQEISADDAIQKCQQAIKLHPEIPDAYELMGDLQFKNSQVEAANDNYKIAESKLPNNSGIQRKLMTVALKKNANIKDLLQTIRNLDAVGKPWIEAQTKQIKRCLKLSIDTKTPDNVEQAVANKLLATKAELVKNDKLAFYYRDKSKRLLPNYVVDLLEEAKENIKHRNVTAALAIINRIIDEFQYPQAYAIRGRIHSDMPGYEEEARQDYYQFLQRYDASDHQFITSPIGSALFKVFLNNKKEKNDGFEWQAARYFRQKKWGDAAAYYALATAEKVKLETTNQEKFHRFQFLRYIATTNMHLENNDPSEAFYHLILAIKFSDRVDDSSSLQLIADEAHRLGKLAFKNGNNSLALKHYRISLAIYQVRPIKKAADFYIDFSGLMAQLNQKQEAQQWLCKASEIDPDNVRVQDKVMAAFNANQSLTEKEVSQLKRCQPVFCTINPLPYLKNAEYKTAHQATELLEANMLEYESLTSDANALFVKGNADKSQHCGTILNKLSQAKKLFPNFADAYFLEATTEIIFAFSNPKLKVKESSIPLQPIFKAIKLSPLNVSYYQFRDSILEKVTGKIDDKISAEVVKLTSQFNDRYIKRSSRRWFNRFYCTDLVNLNEKYLTNPARVFMGIFAMHKGEFSTGLFHLNKALELNPNDILVRIERAHCLLLLGDIQSATQELERVEKFKKSDAKMYWLKSLIHHVQGNIEQARSDMIRCLVNAETEDYFFLNSSALDVLTIIHHSSDSTFDEDILKKIDEGIPAQTFWPLFANEAVYYFAQDNMKNAAYLFSLAIWLAEPEDRTALYVQRALAYMQINRISDALSDIHSFHMSSVFHNKVEIYKDVVDYCQQIDLSSYGDDKLTIQHDLLLASLLISPNNKLSQAYCEVLLAIFKEKPSVKWPDDMLFSVPNVPRYVDLLEKLMKAVSRLLINKSPVEDYMQAIDSIFIPSKLKKIKAKPKQHLIAPKKKKREQQVGFKTFNEAKAEISPLSDVAESQQKSLVKMERTQAKRKQKRIEKERLRRAKIKKIIAQINVEEKPIAGDQSYQAIDNVVEAVVKAASKHQPSIDLLIVEKQLLSLFADYSAKFEDKDTAPHTYLVGGFVQDRFRDKLKEIIPPTHNKNIDYDCDITTELTELQLLEVIGHLKPHKVKFVANLYQLILIDEKVGKVKFDILCNQKLHPLLNDARKRHAGFFYATVDGKIINPLGEGAKKALINNRLYNGHFPLDTIFAGIKREHQTEESMDEQEALAPLRILLYIYNSTKRKLELTTEQKNQIRKDKSLLKRSRITPGMINAKMKKLFLTKHAVENFDKLNQLDILTEIFSDKIIVALKNDLGWLREELCETDLAKKPCLYRVYALFLVSCVCQNLPLAARQISDPKNIQFLILTECEKLVQQSPVFKDLFSMRVNLRSYVLPVLSSWFAEHMPTVTIGNTEAASSSLNFSMKNAGIF